MGRAGVFLLEIIFRELEDGAYRMLSGQDGVQEESPIVPFQEVQEIEAGSAGFDHIHGLRQQTTKPSGGQQPDGVVTEDIVAESQHEDPRMAFGHRRISCTT
jgi:hypothetical protein